MTLLVSCCGDNSSHQYFDVFTRRVTYEWDVVSQNLDLKEFKVLKMSLPQFPMQFIWIVGHCSS